MVQQRCADVRQVRQEAMDHGLDVGGWRVMVRIHNEDGVRTSRRPVWTWMPA